MRYRDDNPEDLDRARAAVRQWREQNPRGTADELVADLGSQFHPDYGPVLRGVLGALELYGTRSIAVTGGSSERPPGERP